MKLKIPTYEVKLCVKVNDEFHLHSVFTNNKFTMSFARSYFEKTPDHWGEGWQSCKVLEICKGEVQVFEVPVNELVQFAQEHATNNESAESAESEGN